MRSRFGAKIPKFLRVRLRRLWLSFVPILQCGLASGLAWWIAADIVHHDRPFFAPIAAVVSLGLSLAKRWRRSVELIGGVLIGIIVGDVGISILGSGGWQISVVVAIAMSVAVFLDKGVMIPIQAASSAVLIATLIPPGTGSFGRAVDALIGGGVGLLVVALVPINPARRARRDAAEILSILRNLSADLAIALRLEDEDGIYRVLATARGTQGAIDSLRAGVTAGREVSRLSPMYWSSRGRVERIGATADPIDNAVRNFRVICRRSLGVTQRGIAIEPEIVGVVDDLQLGFETLRAMMMAEPGDSPDQADAARVIRSIVRKARTSLADGVEDLSEAAMLVELRSLLVDMLMVTGLKRSSAIAQLHRNQ
ncbi:FUSC family protein [Gordonia sp. HY002]|uniref:FUSC family protein n=1 Tax=Gordonia zhenghanii TaxID=2911516 RepID=UPI001EF0C007|nr:FUSC family protein [Gordonia zhenghanii]MCF8571090.1 FUSC family protein [Gordonia zhenghanii]MCF8604019.1 FUSC family protein [Gordonia zhenghanii]